jgi:hypothetical protein
MATAPNVVKFKRSAVAGKVPQTTDLNLGELALNTYDGRIYLKKSVASVETVVALQPFPDGGTSGQILSLDSNGNLTWSSNSYTLPTANTSILGGVKVDGTTISAAIDGTISVTNPDKLINGSYSATLDSSGTLTVDNLTVNALATVNSQTLVVQGIGNLLLSEDGQYLTLPDGQPIASNSSYNVVLIGANTGSFYFTSGGKLQLPPSGDIVDSDGNSVIHSPVITGTLTDGNNSTGTSGYILQSTGTGVAWVTPASASGAVSYFADQGLTSTQQAYARANIGATSLEDSFVAAIIMG